MDFSRQTRRVHNINLTPLIDVMFFLMIFFMLSTTFVMSESMELNLPSDAANSAPATDVLHVLVNTDGKVEIKDKSYDINRFDQMIRSVLERDAEQKILLSSTPGVSVQQLVNALDVVYVNGGKNVQIDHYYLGDAPDIGADVRLEKP